MRGHDNAALNQGLVLSLPFSEGTGTVTRDISKNHYTGTLTGAPAWVQLASGLWVLSYDGGNKYVDCGTPAAIGLGSMSVACWVTSPVDSTFRWAMRVTQQAWNQNRFSLGIINTNLFGAYVADNVLTYIGVMDTTIPVADSWYLVAAVIDRSRGYFDLYAQGKWVGQTTIGALGTVNQSGSLKIGQAGAEQWKGYVALPRYWSRALAPAEIMGIFNAERSLFGV